MVLQTLNIIERELRGQEDQHMEFLAHRDLIGSILRLRDEKNALILGHNYMRPEVYHLSGEGERGDSLALSMFAAKTDKPIILFDGVKFMAETAKILNPEKKVLIASMEAGCSLADNFRGKDVIGYKKRYPRDPVVIYINSYADAKAESDYCCTSGNALKVVKYAAKEFETNRVVFLPDSLMGRNVQDEMPEFDIIYPGKDDDKRVVCVVHENFTGRELRNIRKQYDLPKLEKGNENPRTGVLVHLECPPDAVKEADYVGSTFGMIEYIKEHPSLERVFLGTECEMASNLGSQFPGIDFIRTCSQKCPHMAQINLERILSCLENEEPEITFEDKLRKRALVPITRMLGIGRDD